MGMETDMEDNYSVTVVIPAYNAGEYISDAIRSVASQSYEGNIEVIVVDDKSDDETDEIIKAAIEYANKTKCKVTIKHVVNEERLGVAGSRNKAIELARGEYIAFLDADDWWDADKLAQQIECLENDGQAMLCCSARELMQADGCTTGRIVHVSEKITYDMLLKTNSIACGSVVMKADLARKYPMHNDELHEDYICWLEILKDGGYAVGIDKPFLKTRLSEGGKSRNKFKSMKMHYGVYRLIGIGRIKALYYTMHYIFNGLKKYYG